MRASLKELAPDVSTLSETLNNHQSSSFSETSSRRSQVFLVRDPQVISKGYALHREALSRLVSTLVCEVTGKKNTTEAWQSLIKTGLQGDVVGIKVTTEPGLLSGTHRELIQVLVGELIAAGVSRKKIIVWDRRQQDLGAAGYTVESGLPVQWIEDQYPESAEAGEVRLQHEVKNKLEKLDALTLTGNLNCHEAALQPGSSSLSTSTLLNRGSAQGSGYDPHQIFSSPLMGQLVYGDLKFQKIPRSLKEWQEYTEKQLSNESHYAILLTQRIDKIINVPSLCDSFYCGINGALASMTLGVVDNWRRFINPPSYGEPYISMLYSTEQIKNKVVLTIMDALVLQYVGGPAASPAHAVAYGALLASFDPVAIDATGLELINEERHAHGLPEIGVLANHIMSAEGLGLGHASKKERELIEPKLPN